MKQRYNAAILELRGLHANAEAAASQGLEQAARAARRRLWVRGASYYVALQTWRRVVVALQGWLEGARRAVAASLGQAHPGGGEEEGEGEEELGGGRVGGAGMAVEEEEGGGRGPGGAAGLLMGTSSVDSEVEMEEI